MKRVTMGLIALVAATALEGTVLVQSAAAFPAYFVKLRKTRLPFDSCLADAKNTVNKVGLANKVINNFGAGGTTATVHVSILCIRLPKAGPCGKDGATVIFNAAGDNTPDAQSMLERLDKTFGDGVLIDCG